MSYPPSNAVCSNGNACDGTETCGPVIVGGKTGQKCAAGTPLPDGTSCGAGAICIGQLCKASTCGDGFLDAGAGEQCDFGGGNGPGTGCEANCTFSCTLVPNSCSDGNPCNGAETCGTVVVGGKTGQRCAAGTPLADGASCGIGLICLAQSCKVSSCGDGYVDAGAGEQCDFGALNGPNAGCETTCKYSCIVSPNSCADGNACNGAEACNMVVVGGQAGLKCVAGTPLADGTSCGATSICLAQLCKVSTCGDGFVDAGRGEQCEPPSTGSCDALCHATAVCGNGAREVGEQCDDSNLTNLDGCSATCKFEQGLRADYLKMQFGTDAVCAKNALGGAIVNGTAQGQLQSSLDSGVADGSISILFQMLGVTDLSGTSEPSFKIGVASGTPVAAPGMMPPYDGTTDLDWWYATDPTTIDAMRLPTAQMNAAIVAKALTAGPGNLTLMLALGAGAAPLRVSNTVVKASVGAVSTPQVSGNLATPGHLPSEHLDPALQSYQTLGQKTASGAGTLCGGISAYSLSKVPVPASVLGTCTAYTAANSMLDLLVGGCTAFIFVQIIKPTQPDTEDPSVPPVGAGPPYKFTTGAGKVVTGCSDKNNASVALAACLNDAAYSSYFKLALQREIFK